MRYFKGAVRRKDSKLENAVEKAYFWTWFFATVK